MLEMSTRLLELTKLFFILKKVHYVLKFNIIIIIIIIIIINIWS